MTYSRQQWDRAVGLYIRYECCAADAIHELGYPSKEALRMWYRERLEEERAGVLSRRGERQRRYSEEQKCAAVDHYLECVLSSCYRPVWREFSFRKSGRF